MSEIYIRRAALDDVERVAPLFDAYRQFYEMPADLTLAREYLKARLQAAESVIFIAQETAGNIVGFCQLYPTFCSVLARRQFVLYDLFVVAEARRSGSAKALMEAAERYALEQGAIRMELQTARTNFGAQALYESRGWVRDEVFFVYSKAIPN
jgi:ribosomal protein S18 acetylase RimI-like enzyme